MTSPLQNLLDEIQKKAEAAAESLHALPAYWDLTEPKTILPLVQMLRKAVELLKETDAYLDHSRETSIPNNSMGHRQIKHALTEINEIAAGLK